MKFVAYESPAKNWIKYLPQDWKVARLSNIAEIMFSNVNKHTLEEEIPVRLCNYVDVYKNDRITSNISFMEASADVREMERFQIHQGDILVTKDSETPDDIAIPALVAEELPGVLCGYHLALIRPRQHLSYGSYLAWLHSSKWFRSHYEVNAVGVTRFGLSQSTFKNAQVPLPPISEQHRIAAYLDASCAALDAAVAAKQKQFNLLEKLHCRFLHEAFEPRNACKTERIKDISVKIGSGVTPEGGAANYLDEGIPLLRSQNVHFDGLRIDDVAYISAKTHAEMFSSQLHDGDVLVNITGASIGRVSFVPDGFGEGNVNQHVCIIRPGHHVHYEFLAYFLASPQGQSQIFSSFTGASRQGLSHSDLGTIQLPLPPISEQMTIVDQIKNEAVKCNQLKENLENQINTLTAYRKSLIHECVTGQRRITEADLRTLEQCAVQFSPDSIKELPHA